jgi:hypothetical protein
MTKIKLKSKKKKVLQVKKPRGIYGGGKLAWISDFKKQSIIGGSDMVGPSDFGGRTDIARRADIGRNLKRDDIGTTQLLNENDINNIMHMENITYDKKIYNQYKKNLNEQKKSQKYGGDPILKIELKKQSQFLYDELKDSIFKSDYEQPRASPAGFKNPKKTSKINKYMSSFEQNLQEQLKGNTKKRNELIQQQQQENKITAPANMFDYKKQQVYEKLDEKHYFDRYINKMYNNIPDEELKPKKASKKISKKTMKSLLKEKDYNKVKLDNIEKSRLFKLKQDKRNEKIKKEEIKENERKRKQVIKELDKKLLIIKKDKKIGKAETILMNKSKEDKPPPKPPPRASPAGLKNPKPKPPPRASPAGLKNPKPKPKPTPRASPAGFKNPKPKPKK